ncbi:MAG: universal stress protein [Woeseiaceae bacterium]|nr:universal stress protein [Woeseiaceae bacterium]
MTNSILAVIELDNYPEIVTQRAAWLARLCDAELTLMLCEPKAGLLHDSIFMAAEVQQIADEMQELELKTLEQLKAGVAVDGLVVHTEHNYKFPVVDRVLDISEQLNPIYVVKGMHYHRPSERASMTDIDWQLIRKLEYPLWFAKPKTYKDTAKIIAAVDPTHGHDKPAALDEKIIMHAKRVSNFTGGKLELIHTYERMEEIGSLAMRSFKPEKLPIDELDERIKREHSERLLAFAEKHGIDADAVHQLPGRPHEILPVFSRTHGAGLLIMGALARSSLKQRFVGNTAQRTLDHVDCDVLVVHPNHAAQAQEEAA